MLSSVQSMKVVDHNFPGPLSNKGGPAQSHSKTGFHVAGSSKFKNHSQFIKIRATDEIILEVKWLYFSLSYWAYKFSTKVGYRIKFALTATSEKTLIHARNNNVIVSNNLYYFWHIL